MRNAISVSPRVGHPGAVLTLQSMQRWWSLIAPFRLPMSSSRVGSASIAGLGSLIFARYRPSRAGLLFECAFDEFADDGRPRRNFRFPPSQVFDRLNERIGHP